MYIDNGLFASLSKGLAADTALDAASCLREVGLPVHEEVGGVTNLLILGLQICGDTLRISISPDRRHRLRQALEGFCRRGKASPRQMQVILGHVSFAFLVRRPLLSVSEDAFRKESLA